MITECNFNLCQLVDLGYAMKRRIIEKAKMSYLKIVFTDKAQYHQTESVLAKELIFREKFERKMKMNSKMDLKIMLDAYYKQTNDILIYRNIFSAAQRKMFIIMYNDKSKCISLTNLFHRQNLQVDSLQRIHLSPFPEKFQQQTRQDVFPISRSNDHVEFIPGDWSAHFQGLQKSDDDAPAIGKRDQGK